MKIWNNKKESNTKRYNNKETSNSYRSSNKKNSKIKIQEFCPQEFSPFRPNYTYVDLKA